MQEDKLISVIIPVYKVEKWLKKCVNSVINQTYTNLEIILVDDGSPDKCPEICDLLAQKDSRIKVIHKKNGGVSSARNAGIDAATGDYLCFIDSDDWIDKDFFMQSYNDAINNNAQIVASNLIIVNSKGEKTQKTINGTKKIDFNSKATLFLDLKSVLNIGGAISKIFETSLIKNNNIRFDTSIKFGEDVLFLLKCFEFCNCVYLNENAKYFYNRLVSDSAILKFYPQIFEWTRLLTNAREAIVKKKGEGFLYGDEYILNSVLIDFDFLINYIVNNKGKDEGVLLIKEAFCVFEEYIKEIILKGYEIERILCDEFFIKYCLKGDFYGLYDYVIAKRPKMTIKRRVVQKMSKILLCLKRVWYRYFDK